MTDPNIVVRLRQVPQIVGISIASINRLRRAGEFVPAVRLGAAAVGFLRSDLDAWLQARREAA